MEAHTPEVPFWRHLAARGPSLEGAWEGAWAFREGKGRRTNEVEMHYEGTGNACKKQVHHLS